jgi:hypothetical protein
MLLGDVRSEVKPLPPASSAGGIGIGGLLGVAFIVLKLTGHIAWSWFWVLSPFWLPTALILSVMVLIAVIAIAGAFIMMIADVFNGRY